MQVKENVNLANLLLVGNQTGNSPSRPKEDSKEDFASLLTNAQNNADSRLNVTKQASVQGKESFPEKASTEPKKETKNFTKGSEATQTERTSSAEKPDIRETEDVVVEEAEDDQSIEDVSAAMESISNLLQNVMQLLQLTGEELADKLQEIGMNPADLLTQEGLKELFLYVNSAEPSDLLVDEELNLRLQSFLGEFENTLQTLDLTGMDDVALLAGEDMKDILSGIMDTMEAAQTTEQDDAVGEVVSDSGLNEPEVVVTKEESKAQSDNGSSAKQQSEDTTRTLEPADTEGPVKGKHSTFENPVLQAIQDAVSQVEETVTAGSQPVKSADIINQIVEQVRVHMSQNTTSLEMQLYPEHLGKIQINVVSKDGIMTARIVAENEAAKQAIENGLTSLKETMEQQDLKVDAIEVMVSTNGFERGSEQQDSTAENQASKGQRKLSLSELEEESSKEEAVEAEKMKAVGSSVSYMA
mgnify:FL=1